MLKDRVDLQSVRRVLVTKLRHHSDVLLASPVFSILPVSEVLQAVQAPQSG